MTCNFLLLNFGKISQIVIFGPKKTSEVLFKLVVTEGGITLDSNAAMSFKEFFTLDPSFNSRIKQISSGFCLDLM